MKSKINIKLLKNITLASMYSLIVLQIILFRLLDISSKPEALVNYIITFTVICMVTLLTHYYLKTMVVDMTMNLYFYFILVTLFIYSISLTISFSFPNDSSYYTAQMISYSIAYLLGLVLSFTYGLYFINFYKRDTNVKRRIRICMLVVYSIFAVLVLTNPQTRLLFYIEQDGTIVYPSTYLIINICPFLSFVYHLYETLRSDHDRTTKSTLLSYCFFALASIVIDSLPFDESNIHIDTGMALGSLLSVYTVFFRIFVRDEVELSKKKAELREKQTQIMISQIQPHFLYNTLSAIYVLCGEDPKLAQKTIKDFSGYLRQNMNGLNSKDCVPFEKELEHTKTYLSIEKLRFADLLKVEYDIQYSDFLLPPLTLQPLVENAVKYGIRGRENGGTVKIQTRKEGNQVFVSVIDDGNGFDISACKDDHKSHLGIENTRLRLEAMCGGRLEIQSSTGLGSTVTIILEEKQ